MQSRNVDLNTVGSNNTRGFTKIKRSASQYENSDDYVDLIMRNKINQWFEKNPTIEHEASNIEAPDGKQRNKAIGVNNIGYSRK